MSVHITLPPQELQLDVGSATADQYLKVGGVLKKNILQRTGVSPAANILDVGCGSGRLARHFVDYVQPPGRYVGMDIQAPLVDWCEKNISPANPAFAFYHQDIYNGHYNPEGRYQASDYVFPFEDESFDLIILASVFTHLLAEDTFNYLKEIRRLLKPGGLCFSTWYLLGHDVEVDYLRRKVREAQVGYGFRYCAEMLERCGLTLAGEPVLGWWRGDKGPMGQDLLLLRRNSGAEEPLHSRYETPRVTEAGKLKEVNGLVQSTDPVRHAVALLVEREPETFRIAEGADIEVNRERTDSSALRKGQAASIRFVEQPGDSTGVATVVVARDHPQIEQVNGVIEAVDPRSGTLTLYTSDGKYKTFEIDPKSAKVRVNGELVRIEELENGQRASLQYVPKIVAVGALDRPRKP